MVTQNDRKFPYFRRGYIRDNLLLASWRNALRQLINPQTGVLFTEDEITRATQPGTRFYIEADALDLVMQTQQQAGLTAAAQMRPLWANTAFLENVHIPLWLGSDGRLAATGGSGTVDAPATPGSIFPGSTTLGDPAAAKATDPNGAIYQVLTTVTTPSSGVAPLTMRAITTGTATNILKDTILGWSVNAPLGAEATAVVTSDPGFSGGFEIETDAEVAQRVEERIRHRPAAGNNAHFVAWVRQASIAVETAFVYATALHAGSTMVCFLEKRNASLQLGPNDRVDPSPGTIADVTGFVTPPASPVVPERAFVVVVSPVPQSSNVAIRVALDFAVTGGWFDSTPWPNPSDNTAYDEIIVSAVTGSPVSSFDVDTDADLPGGATALSGTEAPSLMVWNENISRWEKLEVDSVSKTGNIATITLTTPTDTVAIGSRISAYTDRLSVIAEACEAYFDTLGPGELIDLAADARGGRAWRYPRPAEAYPYRAGQPILNVLLDALGGASNDAELTLMSRTEPDLPAQVIDGPNQVVLGHLSIFPL